MFTYVVYNTLCLKHLLTRMLRYIKQFLGHDQDNKTLQILLNKLQNTFPNVAAGNKMSPPHPTPDAPSSRVTLNIGRVPGFQTACDVTNHTS